jgi:chromosome segregation ATPase
MQLPRVRFRLSTLILLVVIFAQASVMVIHQEEMAQRLDGATRRLSDQASEINTSNTWLAERHETLKELKQLRAQVKQHEDELRRAWEGKGLPPGAIPEGFYSSILADLQESNRERERLVRELHALRIELDRCREHAPASVECKR